MLKRDVGHEVEDLALRFLWKGRNVPEGNLKPRVADGAVPGWHVPGSRQQVIWSGGERLGWGPEDPLAWKLNPILTPSALHSCG